MMLSPLGVARQRQRAKTLAKRVRLEQAAATLRTATAYDAVRRRITRPDSLALAIVLGMTVGMLAPQGRPTDSRPQPISKNLAVKQLLRTARAFLIGRLVGALNSGY